ncbi:hypothetical protein N7470_005333 [Penicillium chermesinum]|nr:hypothetical protein N7470_005333 [Penicillium chermesinum]
MAILRTCLRTQRMNEDQNEILAERELASYKQQELDAFALFLTEVETFSPIFTPVPQTPPGGNPSRTEKHLIQRVIDTRKRIADLTTCSKDGSSVSWDEFPIRMTAQKLAKAIERTMDLLNLWGAKFDKSFHFELTFDCTSSSPKVQYPGQGTYKVELSKRGDALRWHLDANELEAILGLWIWSLNKEDEIWQTKRPLMRVVGSDETASDIGEAYLCFQKWIFRQTEPEIISSDAIDTKRRRFGYKSDVQSQDEILAMATENEMEVMAAQDIYAVFLKAAVRHLDSLSGEVDVAPGLFNSWVITHDKIDALVHCFEESQLGTREDALLCLIFILKSSGMLPYLASDSKEIRKRTELLIQGGHWKAAFSLHRWLCERTEGVEFERSVYNLGNLCRRALLETEGSVQDEGFEQLCQLLEGDIRLPFFQANQQSKLYQWLLSSDRSDWWQGFSRQLSWVAWSISLKLPKMERIQAKLSASSSPRYSSLFSSSTLGEETTQKGIRTAQDWLGCRRMDYQRIEGEDFHSERKAAMLWALHGSHFALLYWLILIWIDLRDEYSHLMTNVWHFLVRNQSTWMLDVLSRQGIGINSVSNEGRFGLLYAVFDEPPCPDGVRFLLEHGANPDGNDEVPDRRPLLYTSAEGLEELTRILLDYGGKPRLLLSRGATISFAPYDERSPLAVAISGRNAEMVQLLLEFGCDVNFQGDYERNPLVVAVTVGFNSIIPLLLSKGCDATIRGFDGKSIAEFAEEIGNFEAASILRRGILPEAPD